MSGANGLFGLMDIAYRASGILSLLQSAIVCRPHRSFSHSRGRFAPSPDDARESESHSILRFHGSAPSSGVVVDKSSCGADIATLLRQTRRRMSSGAFPNFAPSSGLADSGNRPIPSLSQSGCSTAVRGQVSTARVQARARTRGKEHAASYRDFVTGVLFVNPIQKSSSISFNLYLFVRMMTTTACQECRANEFMRWICRHHARVAAFLSMSDGTGEICGWAALVDARVDGWIGVVGRCAGQFGRYRPR